MEASVGERFSGVPAENSIRARKVTEGWQCARPSIGRRVAVYWPTRDGGFRCERRGEPRPLPRQLPGRARGV